MFTTLRRTTREFVLGHGSSASALRAAPAGTASSPRPRTRRTGIAEDPAERATAEARQPSQDRVPRHLTSSLDDRHLPTYAPTLMHEASIKPCQKSCIYIPERKRGGVRSLVDGRQEIMTMNSDSPLRTIKFRPLPRSRKTEHVRPLKTIHIAPPPRGERRPLKTIHIRPPQPR